MKYLYIIMLLLASCANQTDKKPLLSLKANLYETIPKLDIPEKDTLICEEFFTDSLMIGRKKQNKIEIAKYTTLDSDYVQIRFFTKTKTGWKLQNELIREKDGFLSCNPELSDFNHDGLNDVTYISAAAARGANEIRTLFIYDKKNDQLLWIKNSADYPNLKYNKTLDCLDAFLVYGGCSTVFLKLSGDSLRTFAQVDHIDGLTVTEYDKEGKPNIIKKDENNKASFVRYKNYKPLQEAEAY